MIAAGIGVLTGLISSLPSPLPDLRLDEPEILVSAERVPLHAGIAFGVGVALMYGSGRAATRANACSRWR